MAAVSIALYQVIAKLRTKVEGVASRVEPLIDTVRKLADEECAENLGHCFSARERSLKTPKIFQMWAREQAHRFAELGRDIADRSKAQIARVDTVVDHTVAQVQGVGIGVRQAVMKPVREASGLVAGIKAGGEKYIRDRARPTWIIYAG